MPEDGSVTWHYRLDLEFLCAFDVWSWKSNSELVKIPSLVLASVACPPLDDCFVNILLVLNIKTLTSIVPEVSQRSIVPLNFLVALSFPLSHNCCSAVVEPLACLHADHISGKRPSSDGVSSGVELPPLPTVERIVVSDPESVLLPADVFSPVECSVFRVSRLNLELKAVLEWRLGVCVSLFLNEESLVGSVVAVPPDHEGVIVVLISCDI